jgi:hypothetical protein
MRTLGLALLLGAAIFVLLALTSPDVPLPPLVAGTLAAAIGIVAACSTHGSWSWLPIAVGALSPLALVWVARTLRLDVAVAVMAGSWLAVRWDLSPRGTKPIGMVVASLAASALTGVVVASYAGDSTGVRFSACLFASALLGIVTIVAPVDPPVARLLDGAASTLEGAVRESLERGADEARRRAKEPGTFDATPFRTLAALADRRAATRGPANDQDAAIAAEVASLLTTSASDAETKRVAPVTPPLVPAPGERCLSPVSCVLCPVLFTSLRTPASCALSPL